jgi:hypothetical protein
MDPAKSSPATLLALPRSNRELWAAFLAVVFGLALLEMGLARRWTQEVA